jgi:hypothetical protein
MDIYLILLGFIVGIIIAFLVKPRGKIVTVQPRPEYDHVPLYTKEEINQEMEKLMIEWKELEKKKSKLNQANTSVFEIIDALTISDKVHALVYLGTFVRFMQNIPQQIIDQIDPSQRTLIVNELQEQIERFKR